MDFPLPRLSDPEQIDVPQPGFQFVAPSSPQVFEAYTSPSTLLDDPELTKYLNALSSAIISDVTHGTDAATYTQSALSVPEVPMGPPAPPRKKKVPTLRAEDWEPYKHRILELHVEKKMSLPKVMEKIRFEYGFTANLRQYRSRISGWGQDKNVKSQEMQAIVRKRQKRILVETDKPELVCKVRGSVVQPQKIKRWMRDHDVAESTLYASSPAASTPSAVGCHTISERSTPAPSELQSPATTILSPIIAHPTVLSPQIPSPILTVSNNGELESSLFAGESPVPTHQGFSSPLSSPIHTASPPGNQNTTVSLPQYEQTKEKHPRPQQHRAEVSEPSFVEARDMLYELGKVLVDQGRYKKAGSVIHRFLGNYKRLGDKDCDMVRCDAINTVGFLLDFKGFHVEAEVQYRRVLDVKEKMFTIQHHSALASVTNLVSVLCSQQKYREAEQLLHSVAARTLGNLMSTTPLVLLLSQLKKNNEKNHLREEGTVELKKSWPEHPRMLLSIDGHGLMLCEISKHQEANELFYRASKGFKKVLGQEYPVTLTHFCGFEHVLGRLEKFDEIGNAIRQILQEKEIVSNFENFKDMFNQACLLKSKGHYADAVTMLQHHYGLCRQTWGVDHPDTKHSSKLLNFWWAENLLHSIWRVNTTFFIDDDGSPGTIYEYKGEENEIA